MGSTYMYLNVDCESCSRVLKKVFVFFRVRHYDDYKVVAPAEPRRLQELSYCPSTYQIYYTPCFFVLGSFHINLSKTYNSLWQSKYLVSVRLLTLRSSTLKLFWVFCIFYHSRIQYPNTKLIDARGAVIPRSYFAEINLMTVRFACK